MSEFVTRFGEDFIDYIVDQKSMAMFKRLKELEETELHKPAKECINAVIEYDNICHDLKGIPRRKFIIAGNPKLN